MNLTYTWAITGLQRATSGDFAGAIIQTYWTCTGFNDEGVYGVFNGATPFKVADIDPATFKPFEELTEADVIGWVRAVVNASYQAHIDSQIIKQIEEKTLEVAAVQTDDLPWAPPPAPEVPAPPPPAE